MRPSYETPEDRENEKFVAEVLTELWNLSSYQKNPKKYGLDFALFRGKEPQIWAYAEVKTRPGVKWMMSGGYYIALSKVIAARQMAEYEGIQCTLVVRCAGGEIVCWNFDKALPEAIWAGRKDRGDPDDMEPHKVFAWADAKRIK